MGIPNFAILKERLKEIDRELQQRFQTSLQTAEYDVKKASTLFEYFVLYNSVLSLDPDELKINIRGKSGPPYLPLPGVKYWRTARRFGEILEPSIVAKRGDKTYSFWFDRPLLYFVGGEEASIRPDIVVRKGHFEFRDLAFSEEKVQLLKEGVLLVETGVTNLSSMPEEENSYELLVPPYQWEQRASYFKFKEEFVHPPLIIECKSFGAVLGNIERYASHAETVVIVTPEKLYEPKKANIHILKVENKKRLSNLDLREKMARFLLTL